MDETRTEARLRQLSAWRARATNAFLLALGGLVVLLAAEPGLESPLFRVLGVATAACLALFGLCGLATLAALYLFAREVGGERYALSQTLLAAALTPALGIGVMLLPLLVVSDATKRIPQWRRATQAPVKSSLAETLLVLSIFALVSLLPLSLGFRGFLFAVVFLLLAAAIMKRLWSSVESQ